MDRVGICQLAEIGAWEYVGMMTLRRALARERSLWDCIEWIRRLRIAVPSCLPGLETALEREERKLCLTAKRLFAENNQRMGLP